MTAPAREVLDELFGALGPAGVITGQDAVARLTAPSRTAEPGEPVVVRPDSTAAVADVVRRCGAHDVAIVPLGGNSGLSGGTEAATDRPVVYLSLERMRAIIAVDPERSTMTAEAGVTIEALQDAAAEAGQQFAPDWGARGSATIGGAIATDAGGNNVLRYGNMREHVLGVEAVLADGRIWDGRRALRKDSSGYDLKHLLIGSEGTLGIVTGAVVRMVPATPYRQSAIGSLPSLDRLMRLLALAREHAPDTLTAFELLPDLGVELVSERLGITRPIAGGTDFHVLVTLASATPVTDVLTGLLSAAVAEELLDDAVVAATPDQERALWTLRDELPAPRTFPEHHHFGLKLDTAVPTDLIARFVGEVRRLSAAIVPDACCYAFGHVGDGNIHMMILPVRDEDVDGFTAAEPELRTRIDELVFSLGGTLSAEHGLGTLLRARVRGQKPAVEWELMRRVKDAFDPDDRLNPGKMLPPDPR